MTIPEICGIVLGGIVLGLISLGQKPSTIRLFLILMATIYFAGVASIGHLDAAIAYAPYQHYEMGFPFSTASWLYPAGIQAIVGLAIAIATRLIVQTIFKHRERAHS